MDLWHLLLQLSKHIDDTSFNTSILESENYFFGVTSTRSWHILISKVLKFLFGKLLYYSYNKIMKKIRMKRCPLRLSVFRYGNRFPIVKFEIGSIMLKSFKTKSPITLQTLSPNLSVMSEICVALMLLFLGVYFFCFDVWCFICNIWPWQWQWPSMKLWCLSQPFD